MLRRGFLQRISSLSASLGLNIKPLVGQSVQNPPGDEVVLSAPGLKLVLAPRKGYAIASLRDSGTGQEFAIDEGVSGLYRLTLVDPRGKTRDVTSREATVIMRKVSSQSANLEFRHEAERLTLSCSVDLDSVTSRLSWRIKVWNQGNSGIRSLYYPQWTATPRLTDDGKADRILYPFLDGQEFIAPGEHIPDGKAYRIQYPGQACIQMVAYHNGNSGLMQMTRDGEGWVKHFRVVRVRDGFDLSIEHNPGEMPGADFELPYETTFEFFHGDWYEAADRYKKWAIEQKWARKTLEDRDIPDWLTAGIPILTYLLRGDYYAAEWSMYFPPSNRLINPEFHPSKIPALTNAYASFLESKIISNPFGWERVGPWLAGEYYPPVGGDEVWRLAAESLRKEGHKLMWLLSGSRWVVNMENVGYHGYEEFISNIAPKAAAYSPDGKPTEEHPPWASSVQLCVGTAFTRQKLEEQFLGCVRRGVTIVQYDQNHGGMAFACYRREHPHPPGYGRWMVESTEEILQAVRQQAKELDADFVLAVEEPCEYFIPYFDLYMGRPYNFFGTGSDPSSYRIAVPVFIYVYHEYNLGYGGSNEIDVSHSYAEAIKIARKFTTGTMLEVDPGKPAFRLDTIPSPTEEMQLACSCVRALRTYANRYLMVGKMLRNPPMPTLRVEKIRMWRELRDTRTPFEMPMADVPVVLASTWEYKGKIAYVFANWQTTPHEVVFRPPAYGQTGKDFKIVSFWGGESHLNQDGGPLPEEFRITIPGLSAMMVEQSPVSRLG